MSYLGDYVAGDTLDFNFTTRQFSTGAPFALSGGAVVVYKGSSTTESSSGVTLTASFDSVTGLNHVTITTGSDGTFYANGSQFSVVISAGTVDSVSVVGEVVGRFTLRAQAALYPTTSGRTLDVSAGGEAGLDWANVGSPTTAVDLSNTTIKTTQKVDVDTIKTNPVVNGGTITFPTNATVASTTNITAGTLTTVTTATNVTTVNGLAANVITATSIASDAITAAKIADGAIDAATFALGALDAVWSTTTRTLSAAGVQAIWDALTSALTTVGSVGKLLVDNIDATVSSRLPTSSYTAPLSAAGTRTALGMASANLDTQLSAISAAIPSANDNADALLTRTNGVETNRTPQQALRLILGVLCGQASGLGTTTATFRDTNNTVNRVVATVDSVGNRSAITYNDA